MDNIYFSGLIGSGKTALGQALARRWEWPFADLDSACSRTQTKTFVRSSPKKGGWGFGCGVSHLQTVCSDGANCRRVGVAQSDTNGTEMSCEGRASLSCWWPTWTSWPTGSEQTTVPGSTREQRWSKTLPDMGTYRDLYYSLADVVYETARGKDD